MRPTWRATTALAALLFGCVSWTALAQAGRTAADRVYTDGQAQRGQTLYAAQCAVCHGAALTGAVGPPLAGAAFLRTWDKRPLIDLVDKIQNTMPATQPGTISRAQAIDLVAHVLKANAFPAGSAELSGDALLKQVTLA